MQNCNVKIRNFGSGLIFKEKLFFNKTNIRTGFGPWYGSTSYNGPKWQSVSKSMEGILNEFNQLTVYFYFTCLPSF